MSAPSALLRDVFVDAVARMDPEPRVRAALPPLALRAPVVGLAIGKAACAMARGAAAACGRGLIIAPEACARAPWPVMIGAHPVPHLSSLAAGQAAIELVRGVPRDGTLLALISGGASALAEVPMDGASLASLVADVREVVARGAPIAEINRARAARSAIKGGKLARLCAAPVITLVASDVVGDDPAIVGSGPTIAGGEGAIVIAGIAAFARAAADAAAVRAIAADVRDDRVTGDVLDVAARIAALEPAPGPALWVLAGEPTVMLPATPGVGGRAVQLALLVARALAGRTDWAFLACGSDGVDGTGPAAGAIVDGATWGALGARGIDGAAALARRDAGAALAAIGATVVTGPTGVNHADLMLLWRRPA